MSASALKTEGQLLLLNCPPSIPGTDTGGFCYRCVFPKPPPIESVIENMVYHPLRNTEGTLVGYQLPPFIEGINYAGLHFHFVAADKASGGCAPDFTIAGGRVEIGRLTSFSVEIPTQEEYYELRLENHAGKK